MIVGVLSDTHGALPQSAYAELADCDHIIHAGDICNPSIIEDLKMLASVTAVLGNNDFPEYGADVQDEADVVIGGIRFVIAHTPNQMRSAVARAARRASQPCIEIAIHGHTHVPEQIVGQGASPAHMVLCPGSVTRPRGGSKPTVIKIEIADALVRGVQFIELSH